MLVLPRELRLAQKCKQLDAHMTHKSQIAKYCAGGVKKFANNFLMPCGGLELLNFDKNLIYIRFIRNNLHESCRALIESIDLVPD